MSDDAATQPKIRVPGLDVDTNLLVNMLNEKLAVKARRNLVRAQMYDMKREVRSLSSILPPQYQNYGLILGWTGKAVDLLARRCNLDGFTWSTGELDSLGFRDLWDGNQLGAELNQGITSALIHSFAIATTVKGEEGEPDVVVQLHDALSATGEWNPRTHTLTSAFIVNARDTDKHTIDFTLHQPGILTTCRKAKSGRWEVVSQDEHAYGMTADLLPYRPNLRRPFGASRITRSMMAIQDAAVRTLLRLEGHMDVYSYPEFWILGADLDVFKDQDGVATSSFQAMLGRIKAIPDDPDAINPRADVKQFSANSPEPHLAALNAYAKMFARESSLPDSSLAITDIANPTSADAYDASQYDLIAEAEGATDDWTPGLKRTNLRALAMMNGEPTIPKEWATIAPKWRNPRFLSRAAEADAGTKQLTVVPWLAETDVGLELLGLTSDQLTRAMQEKARAQAASVAERIIQAARIPAQSTAQVEPVLPVEQSAEVGA